MKKKPKIIIDMDIGDDIDDAFALLLAMKLNIDIIGITTVFQNTIERSRIAKKLLKSYGCGYENVPVYSGYKTPLKSEEKTYPHLCQYTEDTESDLYTPNSDIEQDAVDFLIESCRKYKDELIIIAIGPFTNIAKAVMKDGNAMNMAKKIVIMGGAYFRQYVDWNVICDVEAAKIMFDSINNINCLGADVTHRLKISDSDDKKILNYSGNNKAVNYVKELYGLWKNSIGSIGVLHDPLAVYYAIDQSVCGCESSAVAVIEQGYARGLTLNVNEYRKAHLNSEYNGFDLSKTHTLAKTVDREKIINTFMKCFE